MPFYFLFSTLICGFMIMDGLKANNTNGQGCDDLGNDKSNLSGTSAQYMQMHLDTREPFGQYCALDNSK